MQRFRNCYPKSSWEIRVPSLQNLQNLLQRFVPNWSSGELSRPGALSALERYFRLLSEHLAPVLTSRNVCVVLDLAPCHLHDSLFTLAHGLGLRLIYVPPGMTSSLQPCDTHYFARFKSFVQERWRQEKSGAPGGRLTILMWAKVVASVIETVSLQQWRHAFESTGILCEQQCLSSALLQKFRWVEKPKVSAIMPNENLSQWLFPKNGGETRPSILRWTRAQFVQ